MLSQVLLSFQLLTMQQAPVGTHLQVRLTRAVGTYGSKAGDFVSAVLIAPVMLDGEILVPPGSVLSGTVKSARRVGLGIVHETAALGLEFDRVTLPEGDTLSLATKLEKVDNGRHRVSADGKISGVRTTGSLSYRVGGYIRTALTFEIHANLAFWAIKTLLVQVPEPEIYYPAGVELTLALTGPLVSQNVEYSRDARRLTEEEHARLGELTANMSYSTYAPPSYLPSDPINVLLIGSREQITSAFAAAGWEQARPVSFRSNIKRIRAVAEGHGYNEAPMSSLLLNAADPDMSWQKGLDDISQRHHIRIWKQPVTWDGQEVWSAAATRDVDFAYLRLGHRLTHRIEEDVDQERDKVTNDLEYTSCVDVADWQDRANVPRTSENATGDPMSTDGRLAVIQLNRCTTPRLSIQAADPAGVRAHGNRMQRFLRREILSARSDLIRENIYWRGYEGTRILVSAIVRHNQKAPRLEASAAIPLPSPKKSAGFFGSPFSRELIGWLW